MLQAWGAKFGYWFQGGNLNFRMVKDGLIKKDELDDRGLVFFLTKRGEIMAQQLIGNIRSSD